MGEERHPAGARVGSAVGPLAVWAWAESWMKAVGGLSGLAEMGPPPAELEDTTAAHRVSDGPLDPASAELGRCPPVASCGG